MTERGSRRLPPAHLYARELRLSLRNNAGAYGYSVMITCTLAMIAAVHSAPRPSQVFLFIVGAVLSFAIVEAVVTRGFAKGPREEEAPEVVALGSSLSLFSIAVSVGFAWILATLLPEGISWPAGSFFASITYLVILGAEMSVARRIEDAREQR